MSGFKWIVEIEVHPVWVADGFDLNGLDGRTRLHDMLQRELPGARSHEVSGKALSGPHPALIKYVQGNPEEARERFEFNAKTLDDKAEERAG